MLPFSLPFLTWREAIVGPLPSEMVYMQVERKRSSTVLGSSSPTGAGQNLGHVKWQIREVPFSGTLCRLIHSEAFDADSGDLQVEDLWVDAETGEIVRQDELKKDQFNTERASSVFFPGWIDTYRTTWDGKTTTLRTTTFPEGGLAAVHRRFTPTESGQKEFFLFDGLAGKFRKVTIEPAGRFNGLWAGEKYDGRSYRFTCEGIVQTLMMTAEREIVQIGLGKEINLTLTTATKSRRRIEGPTAAFRP